MLPAVALTLAFLGQASTPPAPCSGDLIGNVESFSGAWTILPRNEAVSAHACILRGDSLRKNDGPSSGDITILFFGGEPFVRNCRKDACTGVFRVPTTAPADRPQGLVALFTSYWTSRPQRPPIFAVARGIGDEPLPAVAIYEFDRLKLGAAVAPLGSGAHRVRIQRQLPSTGPHMELTISTPDGIVAVPGILPGLYSLERIDESGAPAGAATAVLVLASPNQPIEKLYAEARAQVDTWRNKDPSVIRSFLTEVVMALYYQSAS